MQAASLRLAPLDNREEIESYVLAGLSNNSIWLPGCHLDFLPGGGIDNRIALAHAATVDAHVGELTIPPLLQLECQSHQGTLHINLDSAFVRQLTGRK